MNDFEATTNRRILVIDDQEMIHADFRKILTRSAVSVPDFQSARDALFGAKSTAASSDSQRPDYELDFALQGEQGLELHKKAINEGKPYAVAFVDMRMPPGWDGLETIRRLWEVSEELEVVICTAYSDYSWDEVVRQLGNPDRLLILKKPFDTIEVLQLANALTQKWAVTRQAQLTLQDVTRLVEDRTRDLEAARDELIKINGDVVKAHRAAEEANKSKAEFLANVSHEIRTPMNAICGFVELIQESVPPTPDFCDHQLPEYLGIIMRNSEHLLMLIDDLLDLSKIEAGKLEIQSTACCPFTIIEDVLSLLGVKAQEKELELRAVYETPIPVSIKTDVMRFRQILLNLTGNSIKFTAQGSVQLHVSLIESEPGPRLRVDVKDTGIGMTEQQLTRLFHPFTQADASVTRRYGGTGMGLAISRRLAELLGGSLAVTSKPNAGSTFRLELDIGSIEGVKLTDKPPIEAREDRTGKATNDMRLDCEILLAEDGRDNQRLISHNLKSAGASVVIVEDGREAVDAALNAQAEGHPFKVILMDMQMPEVDGYSAVRQLRAAGYEHPIIALTAHAMTGAKEDCLAAGCDAYLRKPIGKRLLVSTVARWCAPQRPRTNRGAGAAGESEGIVAGASSREA